MGRFLDEFRNANRHMSQNQINLFRVIGLVMALLLIDKVIRNPGILVMLAVLLVSIMLHEIAHGFAAYIYGDDTAKNQGRLTLNPLKHIDLVGILVPMFLILTGSNFVIGWAKPVPVNFYKIKKKEEGLFVVSIAGILVNLILAFIGASLMKFLPQSFFYNDYVSLAVVYLVRINVTLAVFNLLPIPPLDGSKVLASFGNRKINQFIYTMERYGIFIIVLLMWTNLLQVLMNPLYSVVYAALETYIKL